MTEKAKTELDERLDRLLQRLEARLDLEERMIFPLGFEGVVPCAGQNGQRGTFTFQPAPVEGVEVHGFGFDLLPRELSQHLAVVNVQVERKMFLEAGRVPLYSPRFRTLLRDPKTLQGLRLFPSRPALCITVENEGLSHVVVRGCAYVEILPNPGSRHGGATS